MDEALLRILACPKCKGPVEKLGEEAFVCRSCGLRFEIRDGIPDFLLEDAKPLEERVESDDQ